MSQEQKVAKVLAEHGWVADDSMYCAADGCWWAYEPNGDLGALIAAHQAAVLAPLFAEAWEEGKESFATALLSPLGRNGMRDGVPNPYRPEP